MSKAGNFVVSASIATFLAIALTTVLYTLAYFFLPPPPPAPPVISLFAFIAVGVAYGFRAFLNRDKADPAKPAPTQRDGS